MFVSVLQMLVIEQNTHYRFKEVRITKESHQFKPKIRFHSFRYSNGKHWVYFMYSSRGHRRLKWEARVASNAGDVSLSKLKRACLTVPNRYTKLLELERQSIEAVMIHLKYYTVIFLGRHQVYINTQRAMCVITANIVDHSEGGFIRARRL